MNQDSGRIWINFKELRAKLKFDEVLAFYGVEVRREGDQHQGSCPLPGHSGSRGTASFSVHLDRGIFQCFACKAKGNVLEFAALMENVDPEDGRALRGVAVKLHSRFYSKKEPSPEKRPTQSVPERSGSAAKINPSLDFELKGLEPKHEWLSHRGFSAETMQHFGVGYCARGMLKGKIAVPLHDAAGKLVGYAGHAVDEKTMGGQSSDYAFPARRERQGEVHEFNRGLFLYNGHRIERPVSDLAVAMDFASAWWLFQNGIRDVVSTMGDEASVIQAEIIVSLVDPLGRIWLVPSGRKSGEAYARFMLATLSPRRFVRWIQPEQGKEPTDMKSDDIKAAFLL